MQMPLAPFLQNITVMPVFRGACWAGISWVVVSKCSLEISKVCCNENFRRYGDAQHGVDFFALFSKNVSFLGLN